MSNRTSITSDITGLVSDYVPLTVCEMRPEDSSIAQAQELPANPLLELGDVSIPPANLSHATRSVLSGKATEGVIDETQQKWLVKNTRSAGEPPGLVLCGDDERKLPSVFTALSPDKETRLGAFGFAAHHFNLPECVSERWRKILSRRALDDDEIYELDSEFRLTPVSVSGQSV